MLLVLLLSCAKAPPTRLEGATLLPAEGRTAGEPPGAAMTLGEGQVQSLARAPNVGAPLDLAMGGAREAVGPSQGSMAMDWAEGGHTWAVRCEDLAGPLASTQQAAGPLRVELSCSVERQAERWTLQLAATGTEPAVGGLTLDGAAIAIQEVDIAPLQRPGPRQASWALSHEGRQVAAIALRDEGALHLHPSAPHPEVLRVAAATLLLWSDPRGAAP